MVDRVATVKLRGDISHYSREFRKAAQQTRDFNRTVRRLTEKPIRLEVEATTARADLAAVGRGLGGIDGRRARAEVRVDGTRRASREVSNLTALVAALGPAAVPSAAALSGAMVGAAGTVGALAAGMGVAALAAGGLGDALEAMNKAAVEPTAANIENLQVAMSGLSQAGGDFVKFVFSLKPRFEELQGLAQAGLLPGVEEGIRDLMVLFPDVERLVGNTSEAMGELARDAGAALNSPFWHEFVDFIGDEAGPTLTTFGRITGNVAEGFAGSMMAMDPLAEDFGDTLLELSQRFSDWGRQLSDNEGFRDFVAYTREVTPQVFDTLTSLVNALGAIVEAAAPIGPVVLTGIEALADTLAFIASIPTIGPGLIAAAAGMAAISRAVRLYDVAKNSRFVELIGATGTSAAGAAGSMSRFARTLGIGGLIAVTALEVARLSRNLRGLEVTTRELTEAVEEWARTGDITGALADQWVGRFGDMHEGVQNLRQALKLLTRDDMSAFSASVGASGAIADEAQEKFKDLDGTLAAMVDSGQGEAAAEMFAFLRKQTKQVGGSVGELIKLFPQYSEALEDNKQAAFNVTPAQRELAERLGLTGDKAQLAAAAVDQLDAELQALLDATFGVEEAQDQYRQRLIDLREQIKNTSSVTRGNSQAAIDNREALRGVLGALFEMIQAEAAHGTEKQELIKKTNRWRNELIRELEQMGVNKKEVKRYTKVLEDTPELVETLFDAITRGAVTDVRDLRRFVNQQLNKIDDEGVEVVFDASGFAVGRRPTAATGGHIRGPGTETSDSIQARLSHNEFVVKASAAKAIGYDRLHHINRTGTLPAFADGGEVNTRFRADTSQARRDVRDMFDDLRLHVSGGPVRGLAFAKAQEGDPYVWGGVGPNGWDCSGFMSGITNAIAGRYPFSRLFTTFSFSPSRGAAGFLPGLPSPFMIGVTNAGAGHMAGTLMGVNVESSGGEGVEVGAGARGAFDPLFSMRFGYAGPGATALEGALFDSGMGVLPPRSAIVAANGTNSPEFILSEEKLADAVTTAVRHLSQDGGGPFRDLYVTTTPQASAGEIVDTAMHAVRVVRRSGR